MQLLKGFDYVACFEDSTSKAGEVKNLVDIFVLSAARSGYLITASSKSYHNAFVFNVQKNIPFSEMNTIMRNSSSEADSAITVGLGPDLWSKTLKDGKDAVAEYKVLHACKLMKL